MREGVAIFTSGKGGIGKTPFALLLAILLRRFGVNVLTLDFNSLNPDFYEIFRRFLGERPEVITQVEDEKLLYPVAIIEGTLGKGGTMWCVSRVGKLKYIPYPPYAIFDTLVKLKKHLDEPFFAVVDTNLNIPAFNISLPDAINSAARAISEFGKIYFFHIWSPGSFRKGPLGIGSPLDASEVDLIRSTILNYSQRNIDLLGKDGENIIHIITPRLFELPKPEKFTARLAFILKRLFGVKIESALMPLQASEIDFYNSLISNLREAYERSYRVLRITDMLIIREKFNEVVNQLLSTYKNFAVEADPLDIEVIFFSFMLKSLYDRTTRTMPLNAIVIPYMVRKLVNFVDALLISEILDEDSILEREGPNTKIFQIWLEKVLLPGKI